MDLQTARQLERRVTRAAVTSYNATLAERVDLNERLAVFKYRPDSGAVPPFEPGQFTTLGLRHERPTPGSRSSLTRRAYSIASPPGQRELVEFYVSLVDQGAVTPRLFSSEAGDRVWLDSRAHGHFTLRHVPKGKDYVFVSTGTGLAPYISMIRHHLSGGQSPPWRRCLVVHGAHRSMDLGYREELEAIAKNNASVRYLPLVDHEPEGSGWTGKRGRVQMVLDERLYQELMGASLTPGEAHVFLCGNPAMVKSMEESLIDRGFVKSKAGKDGDLHVERFWS